MNFHVRDNLSFVIMFCTQFSVDSTEFNDYKLKICDKVSKMTVLQ